MGDRDVDKRLNDYSAILTRPDEELGEDPSIRSIISVSESTGRQCGGQKVTKAGLCLLNRIRQKTSKTLILMQQDCKC